MDRKACEAYLARFNADGQTVAMEARVRLAGLKDLTPEVLAAQGLERLIGPKAGQVVEIPQFIHYHLGDGKIVKALCAVFEPPHP